jgi:antitoxin component YwqK of YwqJK toxin-antitoxin module
MQVNWLLVFGFAAISMPGFSDTMENLVLRDGLYYQIASEQPFSGEITGQNYGFFKDGLRHGDWIYFHDNGKVKSKGKFKSGRKNGPWVGFYANGQLFYKGEYVNGKKQGVWVGYYENEALFYRGTFEDGREDGSWRAFNPDGTPWAYKTGTFRGGTKISE